MLDPRLLEKNDVKKNINSFKSLLGRIIMTTMEEYKQNDRLAFEHTVAECFGYAKYFERIMNCVLEMQRVRLSVRR